MSTYVINGESPLEAMAIQKRLNTPDCKWLLKALYFLNLHTLLLGYLKIITLVAQERFFKRPLFLIL